MSDESPSATSYLTESERQILTDWRENRTRPSLPPSVGVNLYNLFVRGYSCEEIQADNRAYTLGQIIEVRVRDRWDERREKHLEHLYGSIFGRVRQTQMESVAFTTDLLAAAHRLYGDKLRTFLQSGREEDLGEARQLIQSLEAYRKVADILLKLTGQDKDKEKRADMTPRTILTERLQANVPPPEAPGQAPKALPDGTTEVMQSDLASRVLGMFADKARNNDGGHDGG